MAAAWIQGLQRRAPVLGAGVEGMHVTEPSTEVRGQWLQRRLTPDDYRFVTDLDEQRLALQAELERLQAAPVDRMAHARDARSADKRALVQQAIANTRAWLEVHGVHERVAHVLDHLVKNRDLYGFTELPSRKYIKRMLKEQGL